MASAPDDTDDVFDQFLTQRGHETESVSWEQDYNTKRCPDCGGLHDSDASECGVCGWAP
jgi:transposase